VRSITGFFKKYILVLGNEAGIVLSFLELLVREDSSHEFDIRWHANNLVLFECKVKFLNRFLPV
jgi:hypothetical protein